MVMAPFVLGTYRPKMMIIIIMFQKILTGRTIYSCGQHPEMRRQIPFL